MCVIWVLHGCSAEPSWRGLVSISSECMTTSPGPPGKIFQPAPNAMQFRQRLIVTCLVGWAQSSLWVKLGSVPASAARPLLYPQQQTSSGRPGMSPWCDKRTDLARRDGSFIAAVFFGLALCGPGHFDGLRSTVEGCYKPFNLAAIADQPQTRTRRTRQPWPFQKRCVTHSQLPKSSYGPGPAP